MIKIQTRYIDQEIGTAEEYQDARLHPSSSMRTLTSDETTHFSSHEIVDISAGPCRIIVLYNPVAQEGLAGHFNNSEPRQLFEQADRFFEDLSKVEVLVAGAAYIDRHDAGIVEFTDQRRAVIEALIAERNFIEENIDVRWAPAGRGVSLLFDASNGEAKILEWSLTWTDE